MHNFSRVTLRTFTVEFQHHAGQPRFLQGDIWDICRLYERKKAQCVIEILLQLDYHFQQQTGSKYSFSGIAAGKQANYGNAKLWNFHFISCLINFINLQIDEYMILKCNFLLIILNYSLQVFNILICSFKVSI